MTLRDGSREFFYSKLNEHFPGMKKRYSDKFGYSYECLSDNNKRLMRIFHSECEHHGVMHSNDEIFAYMQKFETKEKEIEQLTMF